MSLLSNNAILAIAAVADIAANADFGSPVAQGDVAHRLGVNRRRLESICQALVRAGILKSVRGTRGGYCLGTEKPTLGAIVETVNMLSTAGEPEFSEFVRGLVVPAVAVLADGFRGHLAATSVFDLIGGASAGKEGR